MGWPALATVTVHLAVVLLIVALLFRSSSDSTSKSIPTELITPPTRVVFLAVAPPVGRGGGGGGGGNRQTGPIRRATGLGHDAMTLPIARPIVPSRTPADEPASPRGLALEARPLASGTSVQIGLPEGGVDFGTSTGPGTGGGVGEGTGTGIGSGRGPGLGPGSGGGTGGGPYTPGGSVVPPRIRSQVRPSYTTGALERRSTGSVVLEVIVTRDGAAGDIRVLRSLDPDLDEEAVKAVKQWRFVPGQLNGNPVDVVVSVVLDFYIQ
jgi:TonB family protein